ncbi:hypothetical protein RZS08_01900, partial [Arthrospira platensis SPKY1]|nr:hypothetical protein [Arthrospira platensis SPKY1]
SGCAFGGVHGVPNGQVEVTQTHFLQCGVVLKDGVIVKASCGGNSVGFDAATLNMAHSVGGLVAHDVNLAANQIVDGGACTTIGNRSQ